VRPAVSALEQLRQKSDFVRQLVYAALGVPIERAIPATVHRRVPDLSV
jgi:hypothetical protein